MLAGHPLAHEHGATALEPAADRRPRPARASSSLRISPIIRLRGTTDDRAPARSSEGRGSKVEQITDAVEDRADAVAEARQAWRALREGNEVTYWQQETDGRWMKKA